MENTHRLGVTLCSTARKHSGIFLHVHSTAGGDTENPWYRVAWISVFFSRPWVLCRTGAHRRVHRTSTSCFLFCTRTNRRKRRARSGVRGTCARRRVHRTAPAVSYGHLRPSSSTSHQHWLFLMLHQHPSVLQLLQLLLLQVLQVLQPRQLLLTTTTTTAATATKATATTTTTTKRLSQACLFFLFVSPSTMDLGWQPVTGAAQLGESDDCVLLGAMSSSRSPRPLPRIRTTQLPRRQMMARAGRWERAVLHRHVPELCARAGDPSAQDLKPFPSSSSSGSSCAAAGGTVGGCALSAWMRLALGSDAAGWVWTCVWRPSTEVYWNLEGTRHTQMTLSPDRVQRQPRAVYKYWARLRRLHLWSSL